MVGGRIALEGMVADGGHPWWPPALATSRPLLGQSLDSGRPAEAQPQQPRGLAKGQRNLGGQHKESGREALMTEHMMKWTLSQLVIQTRVCDSPIPTPVREAPRETNSA